MSPFTPDWVDGLPLCPMDEKCIQYDGKRCALTGNRAGRICEPAVVDMTAELNSFKAKDAKYLCTKCRRVVEAQIHAGCNYLAGILPHG